MPNTKRTPKGHPGQERVKLCNFLGMIVLWCRFITYLLMSHHPPHHPPLGATPWPSKMLPPPPATTATIGLQWRAGNGSPYRWFRYALLVPTVARVHFSNLKPLVCILISTGSTWDIGTKYRYVIPQGFGSRMCTLTNLTIFTINTVTKVVRRIAVAWLPCQQWTNFKNKRTQICH